MSVRWMMGMLMLVLAGSGCTTVETEHTAPVEPAPTPPRVEEPALHPTVGNAERLLQYFERIKRLSAGELTKEYETIRSAYARTASDYNRVSYAMMLSLPGASFSDDARALELLDPLAKRADAGLHPLAYLLSAFIQDRRRLGTELGAAQQKLDALKSLERNLINRDQTNSERKK